jgi:AcrR family transcriptional regulator
MQRPDEQKRRDILTVAGRLFGSKAFHEVRLEDIAAEAKIGKGTIYIYFRSKEDLYVAIGRDEFTSMVDKLQEDLAGTQRTATEELQLIVRSFVTFALRSPLMFQFIKAQQAGPADDRVREARKRLGKLIVTAIRHGNESGEFDDPHPELTAQFIPGAVRACLVWGPAKLTVNTLTNHILYIIGRGLRAQRKQVRV